MALLLTFPSSNLKLPNIMQREDKRISQGSVIKIDNYCGTERYEICCSHPHPPPKYSFFLKHILTPKKKKHFFCRKQVADQASLLLLNDLGSTMLLGFFIHVGLTFLVMQTRFKRCPQSHFREEFPPLLL